MKKKFFVIFALLIAFSAISASCAFANTNMINTVENAAQNVTSVAGNMLNDGVNATKNVVNDFSNGAERTGNDVVAGMTNANNNSTENYTATRTSADATWLGMDSNAWTWLIMGIVTVAIVALVWFYAKQRETSTHSNE